MFFFAGAKSRDVKLLWFLLLLLVFLGLQACFKGAMRCNCEAIDEEEPVLALESSLLSSSDFGPGS